MDVAAIEADNERQVGPRQRVPLRLAAVDTHRLLRTELALQPVGGRLRVQPHRGGVQRPTERQRLGQ
jgi:hypothetical protein